MNKDLITDKLVDCYEQVSGVTNADIDTYIEVRYRQKMFDEVKKAFPTLKLEPSSGLMTIQDYLAVIAREVLAHQRILRVILEEAKKVTGKVYRKHELPLAELIPEEADCRNKHEYTDRQLDHFLKYMRFLVRVQNRLKCWPKDEKLRQAKNVSDLVKVFYLK